MKNGLRQVRRKCILFEDELPLPDERGDVRLSSALLLCAVW